MHSIPPRPFDYAIVTTKAKGTTEMYARVFVRHDTHKHGLQRAHNRPSKLHSVIQDTSLQQCQPYKVSVDRLKAMKPLNFDPGTDNYQSSDVKPIIFMKVKQMYNQIIMIDNSTQVYKLLRYFAWVLIVY